MTPWREKRARKRARRECYQCPLPSAPDRTLCEVHRARALAQAKAYYVAHAADVCLRARTTGRDGIRNAALIRQYGLDLNEYNTMLVGQGGVCMICAQPEARVNKYGVLHALAVDHDHETGRIRGLLCHRCNRVLGLVSEDTTLLRRAIEYLEVSHG